MCNLCAVLGAGSNWTDAAGRPEFEAGGRKITRNEERDRRVGMLNGVLAFHGVRIEDWGGNSFVLTGASGKNENVYNLAGIWAAVDRLSGGDCDPLAADFLAWLEHHGH